MKQKQATKIKLLKVTKQPANTTIIPLVVKKESNAYGITSLVTGILSLVLCFAFYFGLPLGIVAIVFSRLQSKTKATGSSTAGLILGIIGVVICSIMALFVLWFWLVFSSFY